MNDKEKIAILEKELSRLKKAIRKQRYGLVWMDIPEAFEKESENKMPILKEVPDLAIKSNDGKPTHILIEGDNYHALTCLNYTHKEKIDVIYIDPPYNTGKDGFRYKDKRIIEKFPDGTDVPKDHPFRHSYWLSFMRKRLELARPLLSLSGLILISVDENELAQLKLLCDEIFNSENLLEIFIWNTEGNIDNQKKIKGNHEYILAYAKSEKNFTSPTVIDPNIGQESKLYNEVIENSITKNGLKNPISAVELPIGFPCTLNNGIISKRTKGWPKVSVDVKISKNATLNKVVVESGWSSKELLEDFIKNKFNPILDSKKQKTWFKLTNTGALYVYKERSAEQSHVLSVLTNFGTTKKESERLKRMGIKFDYPKPTGLISYLLKMHNSKSSIVLDFFAGSGTTGHAVLDLNKENRAHQFILITNNEKKIMSEVCYPRLYNVINGYTENEGEKVDSSGNSLKFYKTDFIGNNNILNANDADKIDLAHNAGELLAVSENTLEKVKETKYYQLFKNEKQYTAIYFREDLDKFEDFVAIVEKLTKKVCIYVFSWGDEDEFVVEFEHLKNVRIKTIPRPILEIYKNIYNLGV